MKKTILEHIRDVTGEMEAALLSHEDLALEMRIDELAKLLIEELRPD